MKSVAFKIGQGVHDCRAAAIHTTTRFTEPFSPVVHEKAPSFTKAEHLQIFHKGRQSSKRPQVGALLVVHRVVSIGDVQQRLLRYAFYKQVVRRRFLASNLHIFEKVFGKIARAFNWKTKYTTPVLTKSWPRFPIGFAYSILGRCAPGAEKGPLAGHVMRPLCLRRRQGSLWTAMQCRPFVASSVSKKVSRPYPWSEKGSRKL